MNRHNYSKLIICSLLAVTVSANAQDIKLNADNIDDVIAAMTDNEKVNMLTGQGVGWGNEDAFCPGNAGWTYAIPRLGIPSIQFGDGPQGLNINSKREFDSFDYSCTHFLSGSSLASTWDVDAAREVGAAVGVETRERGLDVILGPAINLHRNLLGGRVQEYYSEDPLLNGKLAASWIKGSQSEGIGVSLKHFAANNQETNRNRMDVRASQRTLRELYFKGFEIAIKESNPWTVMSAYNYINGMHCSENPELLINLLRQEWKFKGAVISDWGAVRYPVAAVNSGLDQIESGWPKERAALLEAMKDGRLSKKTVDDGVRRMLQLIVKTETFKHYKYSQDIDRETHQKLLRRVASEAMVLLKNNSNLLPLGNVRNIALYGVTSYDFIPANMGVGGTNLGDYHVSLVEGLRKAGFTVYKPLMRQYEQHIAMEKARIAKAFPNDNRDIRYIEKRPVELIPTNKGEEQKKEGPVDMESMMVNWGGMMTAGGSSTLDEQIAANDIAIITLGRMTGEHQDRKVIDFNLTDKERELINKVADAYHAAGKKVVVLLNVPTAIETASWRDKADAILMVGQPGERAGESIADVLTGKVSPSGRLVDTWELAYGDAPADKNFPSNYYPPKDAPGPDAAPTYTERNVDYTVYEEGVYVGYRYFTSANKQVAYPFGFGLSYTDFAYSNEKVTPTKDGFTVSITVTNNGKRASKDVVELYVSAPKGKIEKPVRELKGFAKTKTLNPGESETLTISVSNYDLASYYEKETAWAADAGTYNILFSKDANSSFKTLTYKLGKRQTWKTQNLFKPAKSIKELSLK